MLGSIASLILGLLTMLVMMALAECLGKATCLQTYGPTLGSLRFRSPETSRDTRITRKDKEGFQATVSSTLPRAWIVKFVEGPRERGLRIR